MDTTEQARDLLTTAEAANHLGVGRSTIYRWVHAGALPAVRLGSGPCAPIRVDRDELREWTRSNRTTYAGGTRS